MKIQEYITMFKQNNVQDNSMELPIWCVSKIDEIFNDLCSSPELPNIQQPELPNIQQPELPNIQQLANIEDSSTFKSLTTKPMDRILGDGVDKSPLTAEDILIINLILDLPSTDTQSTSVSPSSSSTGTLERSLPNSELVSNFTENTNDDLSKPNVFNVKTGKSDNEMYAELINEDNATDTNLSTSSLGITCLKEASEFDILNSICGTTKSSLDCFENDPSLLHSELINSFSIATKKPVSNSGYLGNECSFTQLIENNNSDQDENNQKLPTSAAKILTSIEDVDQRSKITNSIPTQIDKTPIVKNPKDYLHFKKPLCVPIKKAKIKQIVNIIAVSCAVNTNKTIPLKISPTSFEENTSNYMVKPSCSFKPPDISIFNKTNKLGLATDAIIDHNPIAPPSQSTDATIYNNPIGPPSQSTDANHHSNDNHTCKTLNLTLETGNSTNAVGNPDIIDGHNIRAQRIKLSELTEPERQSRYRAQNRRASGKYRKKSKLSQDELRSKILELETNEKTKTKNLQELTKQVKLVKNYFKSKGINVEEKWIYYRCSNN